MLIAEVIISENTNELDKIFHYAATENMEIGSRVIVPFGRGNTTKEGFIVGFANSSPYDKLKEIKQCVDDKPLLTAELIQLAKWLKDEQLCTLYQCIKTLIPGGISIKTEKYLTLNADVDTFDICKRSKARTELIERLQLAGGVLEWKDLFDVSSKVISDLVKLEIVSITENLTQQVNKKYIKMAKLAVDYHQIDMETLGRKAPKQAKIIEILAQTKKLATADLVAFSEGSYAALKTLKTKGFIEFYDVVVNRETYVTENYEKTTALDLTKEQKVAVDQIISRLNTDDTFVLRGITGSGKTEVYLQIISEVLRQGKEAIVLVPEISLTPQTVSRFVGRFGEKISLQHSGLSQGERYDEWRKIRDGKVKVAIGARSCIFAPFENLGIIILDEEHESTYKSENTPLYHARDVAIWRGKYNKAVTVLGSATPSVEDYYLAKRGDYTLIEMENRYNFANLPKVTVVDMRLELKNGNKSMFGELLATEISKNIEKGEQTILFHNRRGYNSFVMCRSCGETIKCRNCDIPMTYHINTGALICHQCGYHINAPNTCPDCGSPYIRYVGSGTQKIEQEVQQIFPTATYVRMDADTTSGKNSHEQILTRFREEKVDILIGTQMVTKGLDFPNVTLIGVLSADVLLNCDDFRANERAFALLTQVCGRAGRGEVEGRGVIQTYNPENSTILLAKAQSYTDFYEGEIGIRREVVFPPFCKIVHIVVSSEDCKWTSTVINEMYGKIKMAVNARNVRILGPVESPYSKIKGRFRMRMIIKCREIREISGLLKDIKDEYSKNDSVKILIDTNPYNFN